MHAWSNYMYRNHTPIKGEQPFCQLVMEVKYNCQTPNFLHYHTNMVEGVQIWCLYHYTQYRQLMTAKWLLPLYSDFPLLYILQLYLYSEFFQYWR